MGPGRRPVILHGPDLHPVRCHRAPGDTRDVLLRRHSWRTDPGLVRLPGHPTEPRAATPRARHAPRGLDGPRRLPSPPCSLCLARVPRLPEETPPGTAESWGRSTGCPEEAALDGGVDRGGRWTGWAGHTGASGESPSGRTRGVPGARGRRITGRRRTWRGAHCHTAAQSHRLGATVMLRDSRAQAPRLGLCRGQRGGIRGSTPTPTRAVLRQASGRPTPVSFLTHGTDSRPHSHSASTLSTQGHWRSREARRGRPETRLGLGGSEVSVVLGLLGWGSFKAQT